MMMLMLIKDRQEYIFFFFASSLLVDFGGMRYVLFSRGIRRSRNRWDQLAESLCWLIPHKVVLLHNSEGLSHHYYT